MLTPNDNQDRPRRRGIITIAATIAGIALIGGLMVVAARSDDEAAPAAEPADNGQADGDATDAEDLTPAQQTAVDIAEQYFAAFAAGDVETLVALSDETTLRPAAEAAMVAWWSTIAQPGADDGSGWPAGPCTVVPERRPDLGIGIDCPIAVRDPVAVALGVDDLVWGVVVTDDGRVERNAEPLAEFATYYDVFAAYEQYINATQPADSADLCDAATYDPNTINDTAGFAITGPCADLLLPLSEDVAAWVEAGQPDLAAES